MCGRKLAKHREELTSTYGITADGRHDGFCLGARLPHHRSDEGVPRSLGGQKPHTPAESLHHPGGDASGHPRLRGLGYDPRQLQRLQGGRELLGRPHLGLQDHHRDDTRDSPPHGARGMANSSPPREAQALKVARQFPGARTPMILSPFGGP
jgi:hypothetical protein